MTKMGIVDTIIEIYEKNEDILVKYNIVEVFSGFAEKEFSAKYLI
jgi:hypothetical protein